MAASGTGAPSSDTLRSRSAENGRERYQFDLIARSRHSPSRPLTVGRSSVSGMTRWSNTRRYASASIASATRYALAITVRAGLTLPLLGCSDASQT